MALLDQDTVGGEVGCKAEGLIRLARQGVLNDFERQQLGVGVGDDALALRVLEGQDGGFEGHLDDVVQDGPRHTLGHQVSAVDEGPLQIETLVHVRVERQAAIGVRLVLALLADTIDEQAGLDRPTFLGERAVKGDAVVVASGVDPIHLKSRI